MQHPRPFSRAAFALAAALLAAPPLFAAAAPRPGPDPAPDPVGGKGAALAGKLVGDSSAGGAYEHLRRFQSVADANGGDRAAGTTGYDASAAYVHGLLEAAGYRVRYEPFEFTYTEPLAQRLTVVAPEPRTVAVAAMTYTRSTPEGGITAPLAPVPADGTPGCDPADYAGRPFTGRIALIERGGCSFAAKQAAAADAGAVGATVRNDGEGVPAGTIGDPAAGWIPTGAVTLADGEALLAGSARGEVIVSLEIREFQERRVTRNVIAETRGGDPGRTAVFGAHLDSVSGSPGVNDNCSGAAGLLEVALRLAATRVEPANRIRFAWWSGEEVGLLGSSAHVTGLGGAGGHLPLLYLNFDMIASPNPGQFVYDGDVSDAVGAGPGPAGSAALERHINDFLDRSGVPHRGTDFDGRSDYGPFIARGAPAGGLFSGAEGEKTQAQGDIFGGVVGEAYDRCYHQACDNMSNLNLLSFDELSDAAVTALAVFANWKGPIAAPTTTLRAAGAARQMDYVGNRLRQ